MLPGRREGSPTCVRSEPWAAGVGQVVSEEDSVPVHLVGGVRTQFAPARVAQVVGWHPGARRLWFSPHPGHVPRMWARSR